MRRFSPASARWISLPARGWSRSRRPRPARRVEASDIDAFAIAAIEANAAEDGVSIAPRLENLIGADEGWEVVLAAISLREGPGGRGDRMARLARAPRATVLIGDPRRAYLR